MEISETIARTTLTYAKDLKVKATEKRHINKKRKPVAANGKQKKTVTPFFPFIHKVSVAVQFPVDANAAVANLKVDYIDQVGRFIVVERESSSSILNGKSCKSQI